jgi:hypothetical protein
MRIIPLFVREERASFGAQHPVSKQQDDDLIVIESAEAVAGFKRAFDARFGGGEALK